MFYYDGDYVRQLLSKSGIEALDRYDHVEEVELELLKETGFIEVCVNNYRGMRIGDKVEVSFGNVETKNIVGPFVLHQIDKPLHFLIPFHPYWISTMEDESILVSYSVQSVPTLTTYNSEIVRFHKDMLFSSYIY